jgi:signal transduction histidine kinase
MKRLMEQLSNRSGPPGNQKTDLRDVLSNAVKRSEPRLPEPVLNTADGEIPIKADPERLTTVFEHLIRNAQDATARDGRIEIEAGILDGVARVSISDTGCGMTPEFVRERLFRPFDSTKGSQSMGIGAYQAREYIRVLGGHLTVTSEVGSGTTFELRLPVSM